MWTDLYEDACSEAGYWFMRMFVPKLVTDLRGCLFRGWLLTYEDVCSEVGY